MELEAFLTLGVVASVFVATATDRLPPEMVTGAGLVALLLTGVLTPDEAFAGFANQGVLTLVCLFVLAAAVRETGALDSLARALFDRSSSIPGVRRRLTVATAAVSALVHNTPLVALLMPMAMRWARRRGRSPRGLLLPLSYATVLGGTCTLLGTSTHLVVHGLMLNAGMAGIGLFELAPIGVPMAIAGLALLGGLARRQLDATATEPLPGERGRREYTADLRLAAGAPLVGQTIEAAGLRHLPGLFLVRIERDDQVIAPVHPEHRLCAGDRLTFAGVLETIVDLQRQRGLEADESLGNTDWVLHEAVVSPSSPLVGRSVREANFRGTYNAAVVAVHRHGERIQAKIGDIVLHSGDTLLMQATPGFARAFRDSTDFYLVSEVEESERPRHGRAPVALLVWAAAIGLAATGVLPLSVAMAAAALLVIAGGCLSPGLARRAVDVPVLVVIACGMGLAQALQKTGAAAWLASWLVDLARPTGPVGLLAAIYVTGMVLTEVLSNTACAALLFPVALSAATSVGLDPRPFLLAVTLSSAVSLATPIGYQTNLMVYGPGGYRFTDFLKMGVPISVTVGAIAITMLSLLYL